jgi:hypothetical protein
MEARVLIGKQEKKEVKDENFTISSKNNHQDQGIAISLP